MWNHETINQPFNGQGVSYTRVSDNKRWPRNETRVAYNCVASFSNLAQSINMTICFLVLHTIFESPIVDGSTYGLSFVR